MKVEVVSDPGQGAVLLDGVALEVLDVQEGTVVAEATLEQIADLRSEELPMSITLVIRSTSGFGTSLFDEVFISRSNSALDLFFGCHYPNKYWEGRWGLKTFLDTLARNVAFQDGIEVVDSDLEDDWKHIELRVTSVGQETLGESITTACGKLTKLIQQTEVCLSGMKWSPSYETDEALFSHEVLVPLLRRMRFLQVRYRHGVREYGKDITFSELTQFGYLRHFGLQAKAGDIRGGVNSDIDELLGQLRDAFEMPYYELGAKEPRYISTFIIAISGHFTDNAREKLVEKMPKGVVGSVLFLDKDMVWELIERYWRDGVLD